MIGLAALLGLESALLGCTVGPNFVTPDHSAVVDGEWEVAADSGTSFGYGVQADSAWWQQFADEELIGLIEQLHSSSLALSQARERIVEVMARQGVVAADRRLQLAAALGYTRAEIGDEAVSLQGLVPGKTLEVYSTGLTAGWEIDLWGRVARLLEAGEEDIKAGYADYQGMLVSLAAELTQAYMEVRILEARMAKIHENLELQTKTLELAENRLEVGNGTEFEIVRAKGLLSRTRSRLPGLARSLTVAKNRINVLLGQTPGEMTFSSGSLPRVPGMIGIGLPADLLTRRPDIRLALHRYHAAVARIGAAEALKYPTLSLAGTLTLSSDTPAGLFDANSLVYTLGPGLRFPLLTGNRLESSVAVRKSQAEQARLALEQRIIIALVEVENAASGVVRTQEHLAELARAEKTAARSVELASDLFRSGLGDLFQVLDNQQRLVAVQEEQLIARQQALSQVVLLYRALGGGWQSGMSDQLAQTLEK